MNKAALSVSIPINPAAATIRVMGSLDGLHTIRQLVSAR